MALKFNSKSINLRFFDRLGDKLNKKSTNLEHFDRLCDVKVICESSLILLFNLTDGSKYASRTVVIT